MDQDVDARWIRVGKFALKQANRVHVLLTAEHQFLFLFALGRMLPDRHGHRHGDSHHGDGHNEGRHGVAALVMPSFGFALTR